MNWILQHRPLFFLSLQFGFADPLFLTWTHLYLLTENLLTDFAVSRQLMTNRKVLFSIPHFWLYRYWKSFLITIISSRMWPPIQTNQLFIVALISPNGSNFPISWNSPRFICVNLLIGLAKMNCHFLFDLQKLLE